MKLLLAAALLATPAAVGAQTGDGFCRDVRRLARGAAETPPFRLLEAEGLRLRLVASACAFNSLGGYSCAWGLLPRDVTRESVARRIQACLPGATLATRRDYLNHEMIARSGRFVARVVEHGTERSHAGRVVAAYISAEAAPPR